MLNTRIFDELEDFRRTFDRWFTNVDQATPRVRNEETEWVFSPAFETGWTDDHLHLRFVLPAVTDNDLEVTIQGNQLVVRGERKAPDGFGNENRTYHRLPYGKFERTLDLPNGLDTEKMEAYLHDGVLDVRIPITTAMKPKKIQVAVGKKPQAIAA